MKATKWATIEHGNIVEYSDATSEHELSENQIHLTTPEYLLVNAVRGDLKLAELLIKTLNERIKSKS